MMPRMLADDRSLAETFIEWFSHSRYKNFAVAIITLCVLFVIWGIHDIALPNPLADPLIYLRVNGGEDETPVEDQGPLIPSKIWQIMLPKNEDSRNSVIDPEDIRDTTSWLAMNTDYSYTLVGEEGGEAFVRKHFANEPRIIEAYDGLPNVGMKSDMLRYMILSVEGGVYTDIDTIALKPINDWVPEDIRDRVRLIVGIEFDRRDGGGWVDISHWVQFCQWTIAAAPGHAVFRTMLARVLRALEELQLTHGAVPLEEVDPTSFEVMSSTGPAAWTDAVFAALREHDPTLETTQDLSFMRKPTLFGDILVLPVDGFGMGQPHSHSTNDGSVPEDALVRHLFRGSWRSPDPAPKAN